MTTRTLIRQLAKEYLDEPEGLKLECMFDAFHGAPLIDQELTNEGRPVTEAETQQIKHQMLKDLVQALFKATEALVSAQAQKN
jgi:hypothetical protein